MMPSPDTSLIRELLGPDGPHFELLAEVDSTSSWLLEAPFADTPASPRAVLAQAQRAGRGRRGRRWLAEPGRSLALSLAFERAGTVPPAPGLSLAVGCALAAALSDDCQGLALKWPNDLLRDRGKCGGILIETRTGSARLKPRVRVVVGVGLNLLAPEDAQALIGQAASGLFDGATPIRLEALVARVVLAVAEAWTTHEREGLAPFLPLWVRFDAWHGEQVVLNEAGQTLARGRSLGITPSGALRLLTNEGEQHIVAGDLSLRTERLA